MRFDIIAPMVELRSRQRQMLLARAERVREGVSRKFIEPLSRQIADLQAELRALSEVMDAHDHTGGTATDGPGGDGSRPGMASSRKAPVVFLHIPKTAGTTTALWLRLLHGARHMKASSYTTGSKMDALTAKLEAAAGSVESAAGHVPLSAWTLFPTGASFFTFLREPIDRALSHFCYFHERGQTTDAPAPDGATSQVAALEAALAAWDATSPALQAVLPDNLQVRMLSGFEMGAPASRGMLEAARRNLDNFDVVGLTERFDESTALLHRVYGWRLLALQRHRVRTHRRLPVHALAPRVLAELRRLNALDEELYAEQRLRFDAAIGRFDETFLRDVEALRLARRLEMAKTNGDPVPAAHEIEPRTAEILADTAAAFDEHLPLKAEKLLETLASSTKQLRLAVGDRVMQATDVTRQFRELMNGLPDARQGREALLTQPVPGCQRGDPLPGPPAPLAPGGN